MAAFKVIGVFQSGKYMDDRARKDVLDYCLRRDKTVHGHVCGVAVNVDNARQEMEIISKLYHKDFGLKLRHWVISFDDDEVTDPQIAADFAFLSMQYYGNTFQIVSAVHEDAPHLHIHFVMNTVSYLDGHKYHGDKRDYYGYLRFLNQIANPHFRVIPVKDRKLQN